MSQKKPEHFCNEKVGFPFTMFATVAQNIQIVMCLNT